MPLQSRDFRWEITPPTARRLRSALREDVRGGDVTSQATIAPRARGQARAVAKAEGVLCGLSVARFVFEVADRHIEFQTSAIDGQSVSKGAVVFSVSGPLRGILRGERLALNLLQQLSGVATLTQQYVQQCQPHRAKIYDTRKTIPLWRDLQRHAVRCGGGHNHRFCLDDMILIKDNHIDASGSVAQAIERARRWREQAERPNLPIMAETRNLDEVDQALEAGADLIMLDNMPLAMIREAIARVDGRAPLEVSGAIRLDQVADVAATGVERISVGALTHSAPAFDISLRFVK